MKTLTSDEERKPEDDGSFAVWLPVRDKEGAIVAMSQVRGIDNEVKIKCAYGISGGIVEIKIFAMPIICDQVCPRDPIEISFDSLDPNETVKARVINTKWMPQETDWCFFIEAVIESSFSLRRRPIISMKSDKLLNYHEILLRAVALGFKDTKETQPSVVKGKGIGIYSYNSLFMDGTTSLAELFEDYADDNDLEWYCNPFINAIVIGSPVGTQSIGGDSIKDNAINRIKWFKIMDTEFVSFLFSGNHRLQVGNSILIDNIKWKIVKSVYGERGNSYRESSGIAIRNNFICTSRVNAWLANMELDNRIFADKRRQTKIVDVDLAKDDQGELLNFYEESNSVKWNRDLGKAGSQQTPSKDFREYEFYDGNKIENVLMSTLIAGDGIGLRLPIPDSGRFLHMFPEDKNGFSILTGMMWKKEDQIPTCEPKDLYLRLEQGSLYLDDQNKTWLLKAENIKLEADEPDVADTKPDPTTATGIWLELTKDDHITIHYSDNQYMEISNNQIIIKGAGRTMTFANGFVDVT